MLYFPAMGTVGGPIDLGLRAGERGDNFVLYYIFIYFFVLYFVLLSFILNTRLPHSLKYEFRIVNRAGGISQQRHSRPESGIQVKGPAVRRAVPRSYAFLVIIVYEGVCSEFCHKLLARNSCDLFNQEQSNACPM